MTIYRSEVTRFPQSFEGRRFAEKYVEMLREQGCFRDAIGDEQFITIYTEYSSFELTEEEKCRKWGEEVSKLVELDNVHKMLWSRLYKDKNAYNNCKNGLDKINVIDSDKIIKDAIEEYKNRLIKRLIPHLEQLSFSKDSETYLTITEIAEQLSKGEE